MPTYVAFLRAINLGTRRRFGKDDVAEATTGAGFEEVATYLNTGNVRLRTRMRSAARVEEVLERAYRVDRGFDVPTVVRTPLELAAIAADAAELGEGHSGTRYVSLLKVAPSPEAIASLEALSGAGERVVVRGREAHLLVGEQAHTARLSNVVVERHLGVATNRNVTVIATLAQRWG